MIDFVKSRRLPFLPRDTLRLVADPIQKRTRAEALEGKKQTHTP